MGQASLAAAWWICVCTLVFSVAAASLYLAQLAKRIPNIELAKRTESATRRFATCAVPAYLGKTVLLLMGAPRFVPLDGWLSFIMTLQLLLTGASLIYALKLMGLWAEYRKIFKHCLFEARHAAQASS